MKLKKHYVIAGALEAFCVTMAYLSPTLAWVYVVSAFFIGGAMENADCADELKRLLARFKDSHV